MPSSPLLLVTGLAEGADQIVAEAARASGMSICAVLPMPLAIYMQTMNEDAAKRMKQLYDEASFRIQLQVPGVTDAQIVASEEAKAVCYSELGLFIAKHCHTLIALWDGVESGLKGGTSEVVHMVIEGPSPSRVSGSEPLGGTVLWIRTPRLRHSQPLDDPFTIRTLLSPYNDSTEIQLSIERFNQDSARLKQTEREASQPLFVNSDGDKSQFLQLLNSSYLSSDSLAVKFRKSRSRFLFSILGCALLALISLEIHSDLASDVDFLWLAFPAAIGAAFLFSRIAHARRIDHRFHHSRALAEALRVQFFWQSSGITEDVSDQYTLHRPSALRWVLVSMRGLSIFRHCDKPVHRPTKTILEQVRVSWVENQFKWFESKAHSQHLELDRQEHLANSLLVIVAIFSLVVALSLLLPVPCLAPWVAIVHQRLHGVLHFLITVPFVAAGLYKVWLDQAGFDEQVRNYRRMAHIFRHCNERIQRDLQASDLDAASAVFLELGTKALEENSIWVTMHAEHPLRPIAGA
jgi:hypothetical protein